MNAKANTRWFSSIGATRISAANDGGSVLKNITTPAREAHAARSDPAMPASTAMSSPSVSS